MITRQDTQEAYNKGRLTRESGDSTQNCPFGDAELCLKHWWLGGWNDKDMELSSEY